MEYGRGLQAFVFISMHSLLLSLSLQILFFFLCMRKEKDSNGSE